MNVSSQQQQVNFLSQPLTQEDVVYYRKRVDEMTKLLRELVFKLQESGSEIEIFRPDTPFKRNIKTQGPIFSYLISLRLSCNKAIDCALRAGLISFEQGTEYLRAVNESAAPSRFTH